MVGFRTFQAGLAELGTAALIAAALAQPLAPALAQTQPSSPRVTGQGEARDAEVIVNQVDAGGYPKVTVFATVMRAGQPVKGLAAADFRVREDEVDQAPLTVEPRLNPLFAVVTLDTSGSMRQRLPEAKAAAQAFVDSLAEDDRVRAFSFAREVRPLNGAGADRQSAKTGLAGTAARGDTALYDALYASIETTREQPGRKAVILLSDGVDDDGTGKQLSKRSLTEALDLARSVNVPVYTIGLGTEIDDGILRRVAEETGGQYHKAPEASELRELYSRISEQLAGQYSISYQSNLPADGTERRVSVTVNGMTGTKVFRAPQGPVAVSAPKPASVSADGRISGGDSFETAVLIEPGRTYRLQDHLAKGEVAYFTFEAQGGQEVTGTLQTGTKGVRFDGSVFQEADFGPSAGLALVSPERELIGERKDVVGTPLKKEALRVRLAPGQGGRYFLLVGSRFNHQHRDTEFSVEVMGEPRSATAQRSPTTTSALPLPSGGRVTGGSSFEAATPIEFGKAYRLEDHLRKGDTAYFKIDVPAGKTVAAFVHTGLKGARIESTGTLRETDAPVAGIALAGADRQMMGQRQDVVGQPLKRAGGLYRFSGNRGGTVYVLVGSTFGDQHRDTELTVRLMDETASR